MGTLPDGIVTFLFTDVEGSTAMWEASPDSMMQALNQHDAVIEQAAEGNGGISVKPRGEGDSRFVVFPIATDAVAAVVAMQRDGRYPLEHATTAAGAHGSPYGPVLTCNSGITTARR